MEPAQWLAGSWEANRWCRINPPAQKPLTEKA